MGACLLELTHGILLDDTCALNSAGVIFRLEQGLKNKIGSVTLEESSFLLSTGAKTPALEVSERVQALERVAGRNFGRRGSRGAGSLGIVQSHILMSSSRSSSWFRGQSFQILCECDSAPHCDGKRHQHRWEQLQRSCHVHVITKRYVSQRWRHEQQLSSIGQRPKELRSRGISGSLCLSQSRSGPGVRIRVGDVEKLQFLSEFGESVGFTPSDKGVVFLNNHDTQRGEAQITDKNDDLYQLAGLSLPTHVAEMVADLSNMAPSVVHDTATALFARLPPQHRRPLSGKGSGVRV